MMHVTGITRISGYTTNSLTAPWIHQCQVDLANPPKHGTGEKRTGDFQPPTLSSQKKSFVSSNAHWIEALAHEKRNTHPHPV